MPSDSRTFLNPPGEPRDSKPVELARQSQGFDLFALVHEYQAEVWRYLRYLGCDPARADELAQDTFLSVHARPFELRSPAMTRSYLRKVARNLLLKQRRHTQQGPCFVDLEEAERVWQEQGEQGPGTDYRSVLRHCLTELGERPRAAIELVYGEGLTRREAADRLGMQDQGLKTLLHRVKTKLRACIERRLSK